MNIFSLKSILNSYCFETDSFHNLIFLLTNNKINSEFEINSDILFLLEEPLRTLDYSSIENSNELEEYTKIELNMIVNKLLEERSAILSFYEISNKERKRLKEENIELLKEIFDLGQDKMKNPGIQILLNKLFLNIEILRNYIEKIELKCDNFQASLHAKEYQLEQLKNENDILREKLIKSRENLKNYLINIPISFNNDETLAIGSQTDSVKCDNIKETTQIKINGSSEINSVYEHTPNSNHQEWDKMSFFSKASHFGSRSYKKLPISSYNTKKIGSFANLDYEISNNRTTLVKKLKEIPKKLIMNKTQKDEKNAFFNQEKKLKEKIDCPITQINSKDENTEIPKIFNSKLQVNLPKNRSTTIHYLTPPNKFKSKEKK